jgi:hypothetical protein
MKVVFKVQNIKDFGNCKEYFITITLEDADRFFYYQLYNRMSDIYTDSDNFGGDVDEKNTIWIRATICNKEYIKDYFNRLRWNVNHILSDLEKIQMDIDILNKEKKELEDYLNGVKEKNELEDLLNKIKEDKKEEE